MATTNQELARLAFLELDRSLQMQLGAQSFELLPTMLLNQATSMVDRAFDYLAGRGDGKDPRVDARAIAEEAVIHYVKLRLSGQAPTTNPEFNLMVRGWILKAHK